jgi:hypothetical protein
MIILYFCINSHISIKFVILSKLLTYLFTVCCGGDGMGWDGMWI